MALWTFLFFASLMLWSTLPDSAANPISVDLVGSFHWQLLFDIDNSNNSGEYRKKIEYEITLSQSYSSLRRDSMEAARRIGLGVDVSGILDVLSIGFKSSVQQSITNAYTSTVEEKKETTSSNKITEEFVVGPNSKMSMYRLVYSGPGVTYATETVSSDPKPIENIVISCVVKQKSLLKAINVVYSTSASQRPSDLLEDNLMGKPDINYQYKGKYVWLVPVWTTSKEEAATSFQIAIQGNRDKSMNSMAAGAKGDYRYLIRMFNPQSRTRIQRVGLLRGPSAKGELYSKRKNYGWDECTSDINEGRKGSWLYVCWNTIDV